MRAGDLDGGILKGHCDSLGKLIQKHLLTSFSEDQEGSALQ